MPYRDQPVLVIAADDRDVSRAGSAHPFIEAKYMKFWTRRINQRWLSLGLLGVVLSTAAFLSVADAQDPPGMASPIYGVTLPAGYRDWKLVSVAHEAGKNNDIRAILGNEIALKAFRDNERPFPDGAIIVRIAWQYQSSPRNDAVFPAPQSFVAGPPTNVQVSVKDSKHFGATGGWGYGQFEDGVAN
jgi:hypothetical protein